MGRSRDDDDRDVVAEISGRSITVVWGTTFQQSQWGSARLTVTPTHVVERTKFFVSMRDTTIPLDQVSGATLLTTFNPIFIPLVLVCGLGLLLMMMFKIRIVVVYGPNVTAVVGVKGKEQDARDFIDDLMAEVERAKRARGGSPAAPAAPPPPARAALPDAAPPERVTAAPKPAAAATKAVRCPECDKEYRIPAASAGKKFRCQACQAVIEVPAEA